MHNKFTKNAVTNYSKILKSVGYLRNFIQNFKSQIILSLANDIHGIMLLM